MARIGAAWCGITAALIALPCWAQAPSPGPAAATPSAAPTAAARAVCPAPLSPPAAVPAAAQTPAATANPAGSPKDFSVTGNGRKDTLVLRPKDGDTVTVRLPVQGQIFVSSLIPWAVTCGKQAKQLLVFFDVRGMEVQHTATEPGARATFQLRLIDGRRITVNIRTVNAKYKVGYAVIT